MPVQNVVAVGAGNIGSHLLPHLARTPDIQRLFIIDPDRYTSSNCLSQNIDASDVGKPKAMVQATKLRRINPDLPVEPMVARLEDVPLELFARSTIVICVDNRATRQWANEITWHLDARLIDCGVLGSQNLARVTIYVPSPAAACMECNWSPDHYAQLEQEYPCSPGVAPARPSGASSALGALAASLAAFAVGEVSGQGSPATGYEAVVDAQHHKLLTTINRRNPLCRFDHRKWVIDRWGCDPRSTTVESAIETCGAFSVTGHRFVTRLVCPSCGAGDPGFKLNRPAKTCARCRVRMGADHFDMFDTIGPELPREYRALSLAAVGLRRGDVLTSGDRQFAISEAR